MQEPADEAAPTGLQDGAEALNHPHIPSGAPSARRIAKATAGGKTSLSSSAIADKRLPAVDCLRELLHQLTTDDAQQATTGHEKGSDAKQLQKQSAAARKLLNDQVPAGGTASLLGRAHGTAGRTTEGEVDADPLKTAAWMSSQRDAAGQGQGMAGGSVGRVRGRPRWRQGSRLGGAGEGEAQMETAPVRALNTASASAPPASWAEGHLAAILADAYDEANALIAEAHDAARYIVATARAEARPSWRAQSVEPPQSYESQCPSAEGKPTSMEPDDMRCGVCRHTVKRSPAPATVDRFQCPKCGTFLND